ncbi:unnamed protein product [Onchocerca ochengi]|uniref:Recombinase domain-containing protein n=1 Tax=Onchocerca ochengi TaxID=42157 RepID=A0A182EPZ7_ONCOC|nr:unnamed protein product [Onchocerca ochengi]
MQGGLENPVRSLIFSCHERNRLENNYLYIKTRAYSNARLCQILKAIAGIRPKNGDEVWSREGQAAVYNILTSAKHIEVEPISDWELFGDRGCIVVPFATVNIFVNGNNVGQMIVEQGYAQRT